MHLSFFDIAARFNHLKPPQVLDGFVRAGNGFADRVLNGSVGRAGEFDEFIDWIFHIMIFLAVPLPFGNDCLFAATGAGALLYRVFDNSTGFTSDLLNPANQFFLLAFGVSEIIIREVGPFLFQLAFDNVPVAFDFECVHACFSCCSFSSDMTGKYSGGYLRAKHIHRLCPTINVSAVIAPAKMKGAITTSKSQVLLSMAIIIICQSHGRYGVFTPADGFSGGRLKCWSFTTTIGKSAASAWPAAAMAWLSCNASCP